MVENPLDKHYIQGDLSCISIFFFKKCIANYKNYIQGDLSCISIFFFKKCIANYKQKILEQYLVSLEATKLQKSRGEVIRLSILFRLSWKRYIMSICLWKAPTSISKIVLHQCFSLKMVLNFSLTFVFETQQHLSLKDMHTGNFCVSNIYLRTYVDISCHNSTSSSSFSLVHSRVDSSSDAMLSYHA